MIRHERPWPKPAPAGRTHKRQAPCDKGFAVYGVRTARSKFHTGERKTRYHSGQEKRPGGRMKAILPHLAELTHGIQNPVNTNALMAAAVTPMFRRRPHRRKKNDVIVAR